MTAGLALLTAAVLMAGTATAQVTENDSEDSSVDVSVSSTIAVDVKPEAFSFSNAEVGATNSSSDDGFNAIEIENTGSEYINRIWLNTSVPSADPFGTGSAANYDAANFLRVQPGDDLNGNSQPDLFVNRREYHWTNNASAITGPSTFDRDTPEFITAPATEDYTTEGTSTAYDYVEIGAFRNNNERIYYAIPHNGQCDGAGDAVLRVANQSTTSTELGGVDFTDDGDAFVEYTINQLSGSDYGVSGAGNSPNGVTLNWSDTDRTYDVLTNCDGDYGQSNTVRTRYNINALGADDVTTDGQASQFLLKETDSSNTGNMLAPGDLKTVFTGISVPEGVAQGSVGTGTLRVLVTADTSATTS